MKHNFPSLTFVFAAAAVVLAALAAGARGQEPGVRGQGAAASAIVGDAARRISAEPAIAAELRYRVDAFGHVLVGTGNYLQFGATSEKLIRLDLRMQLGDKTAAVQEIRGNDAYWVRRDVPPAAPTLGRVDLRQLRKSLGQAAPASPDHVLPQGDWIMLGGLSRLLTALDQNFAFDEPKPDELQFSAEGGAVVRLPIWQVTGRWKPEQLQSLTGANPAKNASLPEQLPDRVDLVLGRTDGVLPLFPYRITYWRSAPIQSEKGAKAAPTAPRELVTLEFFNVSRRQIDAREFDYQPGDQDVQNLTPSYVQRLTTDTKLR